LMLSYAIIDRGACLMLRPRRRIWKYILALVLVGMIPSGIWLGLAAWRVWHFAPEAPPDAARLFDTRGRLITTVGLRRQPFISLEELPAYLKTAVIDIEDSRFWTHRGIDLRGIARALWVDIKGRGVIQGASTITQQLAKLHFLTPEQTITRKIQDALYAILLELRFSKEELLEIYLNTIYFGEGAYGIEEAALTYFGKQAHLLTLPEAALLAGLPKAPSVLNPYNNPEKALERRQVVLQRMVTLGHLSEEEAEEAAAAPLELARRRGGPAPYFADYVLSEITNRFGPGLVRSGGLRIYTTLDLDMQAAAQEALGNTQGAVVALDPRSGAIKAMVGGRDYMESQFNRATQALRQPGSAFKPFIYAAAIELGWPMNALLLDHPQNYSGYKPQNFNGEYWGQVTMKQALTRSLNNASVWLLSQIGVQKAIDMATRLGIKNLQLPDDRNLALALGGLTKGVTPLELAAAYAPFANRGVRYEPYAIEEVVDRWGRTLFRHRPAPRKVLSDETAYLMTNMLQAVVENGTGTAAAIGRPVAGKTGTTNDARNAWFIGYTPQLVAVVYVGHDDNKPLTGGGGSLAAPIWGRFARVALQDVPAEGFHVPQNIQTNIPVDTFTGLLANEFCAVRELDAFIIGSAPTQAAPCFFGAAQPQPYRLSQEAGLPSDASEQSSNVQPVAGAAGTTEAAFTAENIGVSDTAESLHTTLPLPAGLPDVIPNIPYILPEEGNPPPAGEDLP